MSSRIKLPAKKPRPTHGKVSVEKKSKTYRLSESKIAAAQQVLGVATATAAIETALDMVVFRQELVHGTAAMLGVHIVSGDAA